jgi:tRNAmet cytidine acetate ligase
LSFSVYSACSRERSERARDAFDLFFRGNMRTVGLITEYNPFHNGHLHHLRESLRETGAEVSVAVMSGHFLQRGEPALVDKWVRTEMALKAGVDLVVELPFPWACNSAPQFARGAVLALEALGGIDTICFGSEAGTLTPLQQCADFLIDNETTVAKRTAELLRQGVNYPIARARCLTEIGGCDADLIASPNNILGIEYLKAVRQIGSAIVPHTIRRIGAGYHEERANGDIASATGIRRLLRDNEPVAAFIPEPSRVPLEQALAVGQRLDPTMLCRLLSARILRGAKSLQGLYQIEDGIENRMFKAALSCDNYEELVDAVKSRHMTRTRVQRTLCYVLNEVRNDDMQAFLATGPLYLHLLGSSDNGRAYLATSRKQHKLPLVANYSRIIPQLRRHFGRNTGSFQLAERMLHLELRATRNYTLLMPSWSVSNRNRDYFE